MFTPDSNIKTIKIISGDCYVTNQSNEMLVTILGSCVAACIRDPLLRIGGMNHFLLPADAMNNDASESTRYGLYAMEKLINEIIKMGGVKSRFEVKVFGGSNVNPNLGFIGDKNVEFVKDFLRKDGFQITSEDLGGTQPRRINYYPFTGKVMMRKVDNLQLNKITEQEQEYSKSISFKPQTGEIELF